MMRCRKRLLRGRPQCEVLEARNLLSVSVPQAEPSQLAAVLPLFAQNAAEIVPTLLFSGQAGERIVNEIDTYLEIPSLPAVIEAVEMAPGPGTLQKIDSVIESLPSSMTSTRLLGLISPSLGASLSGTDPTSVSDSGSVPLTPTLQLLFGITSEGAAVSPSVAMARPFEISALETAAPTGSSSESVQALAPSFERARDRLNQSVIELIAQDAVISFNDFGDEASVKVSADSQDSTTDDAGPLLAFNEVADPIVGLGETNGTESTISKSVATERNLESKVLNRAEQHEADTDLRCDGPVKSDVAASSSNLTPPGPGNAIPDSANQAALGAGGVNMLTIVTVSAATLLFNRLDQLGRRWLWGRKGSAGGRDLCIRDRAVGAFECVTTREFLEERLRLDAVLQSRRKIVKRCRELLISNKDLIRKNTALADLAATDPLTGLKNRRHFYESIDVALRFAAREGLPTSLIMVDVDHFKSYNDTLGHAAGDQALCMIASLLQEGTRPFDVVGRYGGEEFVMLLPGTNAVLARRASERLRSLFARHRWPHRPVTASFGIATAAPGTIEVAELLDQADAALYRAKSQGRDRVVHHDDLLPVPTVERTEEPGARVRATADAQNDRRSPTATTLLHRNARTSISEN